MTTGVPAPDKPRVEEYMTDDVETVSLSATVGRVAQKMVDNEDGHSGFPVCSDRRLEGFVSARDLLRADPSAPVETVMSKDLLVAHPEMKLKNAARVIFRSGIQRLPVVDEDGDLVGIISHADILRSQIERTTPRKVSKLQRTLEKIHDVELEVEFGTVRVDDLHPTQERVYADELEGRRYELEQGLTEPLIVIDNDGQFVLSDGHHRALAARRNGIAEIDAYIVCFPERIDLGMVSTAEANDLTDLDDIEIIDYANHPLIEKTEFFGDGDRTDDAEDAGSG